MNNPSTCPHFSLCSGCELGEDFLEPPIWKEALAFFQTVAPHLRPSLITEGFDQTRFKAKLAVRPPLKIGLFKKGTHEVLPIPRCQVHHASINQAVALIKKEMEVHSLSAYQENPPSGILRYIQLFVCKETDRIQLALIVNAIESDLSLNRFCQSLQKTPLFHSIWLNFHPAVSNRILGDEWQPVSGDPFLFQTLHGTQIAFHPGAFSQSHLPLFEKILEQIDHWTRPNEKILELYAGVGAIGLSLRHKASRLHLIESNPFAHLSYLESLKKISPSERSLLSYECIDAKEASLEPNELLIVDPPRKGLDATLLQKICRLNESRLVYLSCGFESFRKDCAALLSTGWLLKEVRGYLLFPGTNHVETLALFEKR